MIATHPIPVQTERAAWHRARVGKFTASNFGALMTMPRSATARAAGAFAEAGQSYITAKAIERATGIVMDEGGGDSFGSRRGLMLEPAALFLLRDVWTACSACTWQQFGDNLGSTPDALVNGGDTMDLKCPTNPADVVRFGLDVPDGDFDALLAWDAKYAWQIMVQALTCGSDRAHLVYFTDMLPIIKITDKDRALAQALIDDAADLHSEDARFPWSYQYASDGFFFVARSFTLTPERRELMLSTLARAEAECQRIEKDVRYLIHGSHE
jgi:hypothetical protein